MSYTWYVENIANAIANAIAIAILDCDGNGVDKCNGRTRAEQCVDTYLR
jgi:hypothetical protein